jgi:hypothetical protein
MTKVHHAEIPFTWRARPQRYHTPSPTPPTPVPAAAGDSVGIQLQFEFEPRTREAPASDTTEKTVQVTHA